MCKIFTPLTQVNQICVTIRSKKADCLFLIAVSLVTVFSMDVSARQLPSDSDQLSSDAAMIQATERCLGIGEPQKLTESKRRLPKIHELAQSGHSQALYLIGEMFSRGLKGFTKNEKEGLCWTLIAAKKGHPRAQLLIGIECYKKKDRTLAIRWYGKSAKGENELAKQLLEKLNGLIEVEANDLDALTMQATGMTLRITKPQKMVESKNRLPKVHAAAQNGSAQAMFLVGQAFSNGWKGFVKDEQEGLRWFFWAAKTGHPDAQAVIGSECLLKKDPIQSRYWLRKSATAGNELAKKLLSQLNELFGAQTDYSTKMSDAAYQRGRTHRDGIKVRRDYKKALFWFSEAASSNHVSALNDLGVLYQKGHGASKDIDLAIALFRKAGNLGSAEAQKNLGQIFYGRKEYEKALGWFLRAANQNHSHAQYCVGVMLQLGRGASRNYSEAAIWYRKSAEQGHAISQVNLGAFYFDGTGVVNNDVEAVNWYRKAADQGDSTAMNNLGIAFQAGRGVEQDDDKSIQWYRKAAELGNKSAKKNLAAMLNAARGSDST